MREELKKYKVAIECFCGDKIIVTSDSLVDLLSNIQLNMIEHIKANHPQEMDKFMEQLKQNMFQMFNKMFGDFGDFFKGEDWNLKDE